MRIYLVRHGESEMNANRDIITSTPDHAVPLTDKGLDQASKSGRYLANDLVNADVRTFRVWASPYKRARQTAHCLMDKLGPEVFKYDYREHIMLCEQQFGLFDGVPDEQIENLFPLEHKHYDLCERHGGKFWARMPLGESRFDLAIRVHQSFGTFHRDHDRHGINNIIVVCHGATLRAFVMMWLHKTPEWFESEPNPANCAIRLLEDGEDKGYIFKGFPKER